MWGWLTGKSKEAAPVTSAMAPKVAPAVAAAPKIIAEVTQNVGPLDPNAPVTPLKVQHAVSRLDAIYRTIDQNPGRLTPQHLEECRAETREHVHTLVAAGLLNDRQGLAIVEANKGLQKGSV